MAEDRFNPGWPKDKRKKLKSTVNMKNANGRKHGQYWRLRDEFNFGKYRGEIVQEVAKKDPDYIFWCLENVEHFVFTVDALKKLKEIMGVDEKVNVRSRYNVQRYRRQDTYERFQPRERGRFGDNEYSPLHPDKEKWE